MTRQNRSLRRPPAALLLLIALLSAFSLPRAAQAAYRAEGDAAALRAAPDQQPGAEFAPRLSKLGVSPAALIERLAPFALPLVGSSIRISLSSKLKSSAKPGVALGHFHGQRRIPRMNSDEPPRG
jgi:hypothetical protein